MSIQFCLVGTRHEKSSKRRRRADALQCRIHETLKDDGQQSLNLSASTHCVAQIAQARNANNAIPEERTVGSV